MDEGAAAGVARVVLVANDDSGDAPVSLSAEIAEAFQAELNGLFIRDQRLRDLVASPFAQTFTPGAGAKRPLTSKAIESAWIRNEERFRRLVTDRASQRKVSCSFRRAEGAFDACLLDGLGHRDLIAITREPLSAGIGLRTGVIQSVAKHAHSLLVMGRTVHRREPPRRAPIVVLESAIDRRRRQIQEMALRLSQTTGRPLILLTSKNTAAPGAGHESVPSQLSGSVRYLPQRSPQDVINLVNRLTPALIVADAHQEEGGGNAPDEDLLNALLTDISAALLLLAAD